MYNIKEIKVLHTEKEVNEHLDKGWVILAIFSSDCYVLGLRKPDQ